MKTFLTALLLACICIAVAPIVASAQSDEGPLYFIGGAIGASVYGPDRVNVSNLAVTSWAALQVDPVFELVGLLKRDSVRTWRFFAAFQYYKQNGDGAGVPDLDVTGYKLLFANDIFKTKATLLIGGGFLNSVKATLTEAVDAKDAKADRRGGGGASVASPLSFNDGLEFDVGVSVPIASHVNAIGMIMLVDKGELGTEVNGYFALGLRRPMNLLRMF